MIRSLEPMRKTMRNGKLTFLFSLFLAIAMVAPFNTAKANGSESAPKVTSVDIEDDYVLVRFDQNVTSDFVAQILQSNQFGIMSQTSNMVRTVPAVWSGDYSKYNELIPDEEDEARYNHYYYRDRAYYGYPYRYDRFYNYPFGWYSHYHYDNFAPRYNFDDDIDPIAMQVNVKIEGNTALIRGEFQQIDEDDYVEALSKGYEVELDSDDWEEIDNRDNYDPRYDDLEEAVAWNILLDLARAMNGNTIFTG